MIIHVETGNMKTTLLFSFFIVLFSLKLSANASENRQETSGLWKAGVARFAVNRINNVESALDPLEIPACPVDHSVPVIKITGLSPSGMAHRKTDAGHPRGGGCC